MTNHDNLDKKNYLDTANDAISTLRKGFNMKDEETSDESEGEARTEAPHTGPTLVKEDEHSSSS